MTPSKVRDVFRASVLICRSFRCLDLGPSSDRPPARNSSRLHHRSGPAGRGSRARRPEARSPRRWRPATAPDDETARPDQQRSLVADACARAASAGSSSAPRQYVATNKKWSPRLIAAWMTLFCLGKGGRSRIATLVERSTRFVVLTGWDPPPPPRPGSAPAPPPATEDACWGGMTTAVASGPCREVGGWRGCRDVGWAAGWYGCARGRPVGAGARAAVGGVTGTGEPSARGPAGRGGAAGPDAGGAVERGRRRPRGRAVGGVGGRAGAAGVTGLRASGRRAGAVGRAAA